MAEPFPNRLDLFAAGRASILGTSNLRINPKVIDLPGSDVNLILGSGAIMGERLSRSFARCAKDLFVETATGSALDRVAFDRYGLTRKPANPANVAITLSRATFGAGGGTVPAGTRIGTIDGTVFSTDLDIVFGATDLVQTGTATAALTGVDGNVPTGSLTQVIDVPFDSTITSNNLSPAAGGAEEEGDDAFKGRIRGYFSTLRKGTLGAIEQAAIQIPGVQVAKAFEVTNLFAGFLLPAAAVELVVADANGNASPAMIQAVIDSLVLWRAGGIPVNVIGGQIVYEPIIWHLRYQTGVDTDSAQDAVRNASVAVTQFLAGGDPLLRSSLLAAARTVPGVILWNDALVAPAGDVFPTDNSHLIRARVQDVSFV